MAQLPHPEDTIAALASAPGAAASGIVRVSGPRAIEIVREGFVPDPTAGRSAPLKSSTTLSRSASFTPGGFLIAGLRRPLPVDLCIWPGRRSYTGEPLAELHTLGSPPLLEALLADLFTRGIRPAQPGEFTLRAFLAGRIDLMQAEGVLGVIDARGRAELHQALEQLGGGVSSQVVRLRGDLLDLLADLEAGLDFSEEDIEFVSHATLVGRIGLARDAVSELRNRAQARLRSSTRPRVVLAGPPNAGKSTLFNLLVGQEAAIVSHHRGTTRDYLAADVAYDGVPFTLIDTAGEEATDDQIGQAAQRQREEQLAGADLIVWCQPADSLAVDDVDSAYLGTFEERLVIAITRIDLAPTAVSQSLRFSAWATAIIEVSARSKASIDLLASAIASRLTDPSIDPKALLGTTAARCRESLHGAHEALTRALAITRGDADQELLAIELRETLDELGKIVGAVYTDDILDRIFSRFCIGK